MRQSSMAMVLAFGLSIGSGCSGFIKGAEHAAIGKPVTEQDKKEPGYDWGVAVTNLLIAIAGYAARHYQDKLKVQIPPKEPKPGE